MFDDEKITITLFMLSMTLPVCVQSTVTFTVRISESYRSFWRDILQAHSPQKIELFFAGFLKVSKKS